ncbi:hypothetical protein I551_9130 [Mycobacterium ulcerans str. Harvey]|uniref:DUF222 domain-containing protein n=1 Tax=Mycobacterium ulcerans str. Harvey TaxID=1299332 RepID=A0ABN0R967_MYCUL|nr:hypothetical protein I551_9130 [Mycobacterium ulcerans str. Harvey]
MEGSVVATAGQALDRRLDELAATVCAADPRTRKQRRADALGRWPPVSSGWCAVVGRLSARCRNRSVRATS